MTIADVKPGHRYSVRGDVVDVIEVVAGATPRAARVRFILREKARPRGALAVGDTGELGIVNFVSWGRHLGKTPPPARRKATAIAQLVAIGMLLFPHVAGAATLPNEPGAIATTDTATVCSSGYASSVRPRGEEWHQIKRALYERAGLPRGQRYGYVADHIVPLELGGAPADLRNLWLQPYSESHAKDRVEDELHILVCDSRMALTDAQRRIAHDWTTAVPAGIVLTARERALLDRQSTPDY